ncbi:Hypothetical predicted protein [Mytilus galloprovincialis]|uniref:Endonuclease/exonuclease/phosphatase domain-containing protein n=1 Tax=Mytilus galloprovincialis TaxID=29158 RepID=A0A8B6EDU4_MYTGA|nr:Hypothetical predicted protein [Mytilus galloprovincialis]
MQAQHPQMIYHRAAVATQLSPLDSNNSIAVTPSIHPHSQTHHMSSTQGKVQINTSSNKIVPELITKSCVSNDISNSSSGDSKNSFAVTPSTHLHSQIHHMSSTQGKVQINTSTDKNVPEHISNSYSYVPNVLISNSSTGDSKNSFAVRKENGMKANLNVPSQSGPPRDSPKPYPENPDPNTILNSSNSNSKNCFAVEQRSFNSNKNYFDEILDKHDIVLIQEHWLFNYEKELLKQHHSDFITFSRQIDDNEPLSPISRPRGHGGIAILYRKSMSTMFSQLPDGDNRIQAIEISTTKDPICLINVYLPSRGTDKGHDAYRAALDILKELLLKYQRTHSIIIAGDFNASFHRQYKDTQDELFKNFCKENQIELPSNYPIDHTYHQGDSKSQIDYILTKI